MGRDDDAADAPRRMPGPSAGGGGNGSRAKRSAMPPPPGGLKYDPTMPTPHHLHHHAPPHHVYAAAAAVDPHYAAYAQNDYHQHQQYHQPAPQHIPHHHAVQYAGEAPGSATNKRKRVKKEREDDWAPAAPPPPPPAMVYASGSASDMPLHMAMPTILHRSNSTSAAAAASASANGSTAAQVPYEAAYATHAQSAHAAPHTIFNEAPVVIESFAETERRRANAASASASSASSGVDLSHLVHSDQTASATSSPKSSTNGVSAWSTRGVASGTMSVYDVFFPASSRTKEGGGASTRNGTRESKRRRRNNGDTADRSSTRATNRRSAVVPDDGPEVDMLRFTVDSFKLIPQGLVDRIDARLRPRVVTALIGSHVENWIKRAGFDDQNFLQEITTLLNVYYPCTHPMILDEVLVAFVFKRPELMERMVKSIIERIQKSGESANSSKYPFIESFAKRCGEAQRGGILNRDTGRHDLACLTGLRLLLERNTEKFMLSPWIASCASVCSDEVLDVMWGALLRPLVSSGKTATGSWNVHHPLDQVFELLREEKQLSRYADGDSCKLSMTLIKKIVLDDAYADLRTAAVACEAFEIFFGRNTNSAPLISAWLASEESGKVSTEDAVKNIMLLMIENCGRLSVKKTNWFIRHALGFVLSASSTRISEELFLDHAGLLLGGVDRIEIDEIQALKSSEAERDSDENKGRAKAVVVGKVTSNEKNTEAGVTAQLGSLLESLRGIPEVTAVSLLQTWSKKWCSPDVLLPWSYVWGVVSCSITTRLSNGAETSSLDVELNAFASGLVKHYLGGLLTREDGTKYLPRTIRILKFTIQHLPGKTSTTLLECVLEAISNLHKSSPLAEKAYNIVATTFAEQISTNGAVTRPGVEGGKTEKIDRKPQQRVELLHALDTFISRQDPIGRLVRNQLLRRSRMGKILLQVLQDGDDADASAAVKVMNSAVANGTNDHAAGDTHVLWTASAIERIVALAYRVRLPGTRQDAIILLNNISHATGVCTKSLLWTMLKLCTNYCCGCSAQSRAQSMADSNHQLPEAAVAFADLTKFVLKRVPREVVADVGDFIHQHIRSCGPRKEQWNLFLVLVLDRVVQLGWSSMAAAPKLVHVVLSPFDVAQPSSILVDRIVQLRALKSLCVVLLTESSTQRLASKQANWLPVARILTSDQLAAKLKSIGSQNACATSMALSQSIAVLCEDIKQNIEVKNSTNAGIQSRLVV